jgi:DNA-binding transcriptional LysR family regulator
VSHIRTACAAAVTASPYRRLDLDGLRAFAEVAARLSFLEAAEVLALSPSALTRRVKRLEADLQLVLLERTTRRVALTRAGRELLPRAQRVLAETDDCMRWLERSSSAGADELTIACVPTIAKGLLPRLISDHARRRPELRIRIVEAHVATILRKLHEGEVDLGIGFMPTPDPALLFDELMVDPYDLACPRDHPLAAMRSVTWADLERHALIISGNGRTSGNRQVLDGVLKTLDRDPGRLVQIEHLSTALGLVQAGLGITVVPRSALTAELRERLAIRPLTAPLVTRTIGVIRRRGGELSPAARAFRLALRRLAPLDVDRQPG